jgi:hypothetical protein
MTEPITEVAALAANEPEVLYRRLHSLSKSLEARDRIDSTVDRDAYPTILDAMRFVHDRRASGEQIGHLRERQQLEQEWCALRALQRQHEQWTPLIREYRQLYDAAMAQLAGGIWTSMQTFGRPDIIILERQ